MSTEENEKTIELSHFATITIRPDGSGSIDGALIDDRPDGWEDDPFHVAIDNLFGLALYHALAGVDVGSKEYALGFEHQMSDLVESYAD